MHKTLLLGSWIIIMALGTAADAKQQATFYTPERVAIGRANLAEQGWAQTLLKRMTNGDGGDYYVGREFASAKSIVAKSDDFVWLLQPTTLLPRRFTHETIATCPIHGTEVRKINAWTAWRTDPLNHPYQVQCRLGGEWYPSNNYAAGDMTSGEFPDDGSGCLYQGKRYYFLRDYAHMVYGNTVIPALRSLSQAWQLTGDKTYAHKACVLLARLATEYPNFTDRKDRLFYAPFGGRDPHYTWKTGGMITDLIWETFCLEATTLAYDGLYDYMDQDPELIVYLKGKGMPVENGQDLRRYVEENLIRVGMQGILNGHIHGNEGFHQAAALACALVMDDYDPKRHPNSLDMIEYAYHGGGHCAYLMINSSQRDGGGHESPGYNSIKSDFIRVARFMEECRKRHPDLLTGDKYPDLFGNPKSRAMFDYFIDIETDVWGLPSIGDACGIQAPRRNSAPPAYSYLQEPNVYAFVRYGDPRFARACTRRDGSIFAGELWESFPAERMKQVLASPASEIRREPRLLDGYGVAILETGKAPDNRAAILNYASLVGHGQQDNLNLELQARGLDVLPDLGYPFTWDYRYPWDANIMAHNTVSVDETQSKYYGGGNAATLFASRQGVHVVVAHHDPYPLGFDTRTDQAHRTTGGAAKDVDLYERTVLLVDVDPQRFYVVDLFAVAGGQQHDQSWHGPLTPVQAPALNWQTQPGTLAGPEVAQFAEYTDRWGRKEVNFPSFLTNIRRATVTAPATWSWDYGLPEGDRLNLHVIPLGGPAEVILGQGRSPARPANWNLDYLFVRRQAQEHQPSLFLSVLDCFQKTPVVQGVRVISEKPLVIEVTRPDGHDEITLSLPDGPSRTTAHRAQGVRVRSFAGQQCVRDVQIGQPAPGQGPGFAQAQITGLDYEAQTINVPYQPGLEQVFAPQSTCRIYNDRRSALYTVKAVDHLGDNLRLTLSQTALVARGPVTKATDGCLSLGAYLTFTSGALDKSGKLLPGNDYYAGCWLGEGREARQVRGVVRAGEEQVLLQDQATAADLTRQYGGKVVTLWQYGVGDKVEVAKVK